MSKKKDRERAIGGNPFRGNYDGPIPTYSATECEFPSLFGSTGCCICGHSNAQECPCDRVVAIVHLERAHAGHDSTMLREASGCMITDSESVEIGPLHQGMFEAPCGDTVQYITEAQFPTMAHYRWHSTFDHVAQGACGDPTKCIEGVTTGKV